MPLGQAFNQAFQGALSRAQQRRAERATQRFRQQQLQQRAEQARKQRELDRTQFEAQQERAERRFEQGTVTVDRGEVDYLSGTGTARLDADTAASMNAQDRQEDTLVSVPRSELGLDGDGSVQMTPGSFANFRAVQMRSNRAEEQQRPTIPVDVGGQTIQAPIPDRVIARAALRKMESGPQIDLGAFEKRFGGGGGATGQQGGQAQQSGQGQQDQSLPEGGFAESPLGEPLTKAFYQSAAGKGLAGAQMVGNFLSDITTANLSSEERQQYRQTGAKALGDIKTALDKPPQQRTRPLARASTRLQKARQKLQGFEQTEEVTQLRQGLKGMQQLASRLSPGSQQSGPMRKGLQQGVSRLLKIINSEDATNAEVTGAINELLQIRKQTDQQ
jgi:hypothetical protein